MVEEVVVIYQCRKVPDFLVDREVDLLNIMQLQQVDREILHHILHLKVILVDHSLDQVVHQDYEDLVVVGQVLVEQLDPVLLEVMVVLVLLLQ
jgi:hypothetical protein